jgi:hypothetical protein
MKSKAGAFVAVLLVAPAIAALAAIVSAQETDVPTDTKGDMLACPSGTQVQSRFTLNGDAWEVTGVLSAGLEGTITVSGPSGDVSVTPTVNLVVTGDPQAGQPVTMSGTIAMTGEMVAISIVDACLGAESVGDEPAQSGSDGSDSADSADEDDDGDDDGDDTGSAGNQKIAEAIADEFDTTPGEVLALHDQGIGFGAIFKLYLIARANDMTVDELLADIDEDGGGFAFGKLKKSLTEEEMAVFEDGPKNLGQLVSGSNHDDNGDSDDNDADEHGKSGQNRGRGHEDERDDDAKGGD